MIRNEVIDLLTIIAATDKRTVGESDVALWCEYVGDLRFDDAKTAVVDHYRTTREWLMPVDIVAGVRRIRAARLAAAPPPCPDVDPNDVAAYQAERRRLLTAIADGHINPNQIGN